MKVNDLIQKCERDLTTAEITDMVAKDNRQVDLIFAEKRTDDAGYLTWGRRKLDQRGRQAFHSDLLAGWPRAQRIRHIQ